jgi:hypothetical protein
MPTLIFSRKNKKKFFIPLKKENLLLFFMILIYFRECILFSLHFCNDFREIIVSFLQYSFCIAFLEQCLCLNFNVKKYIPLSFTIFIKSNSFGTFFAYITYE